MTGGPSRMDVVAIGIALADAPNRELASTAGESDMVERLCRHQPKAVTRKPWSAGDDCRLLGLARTCTAVEMARRLDRTPWSVRSRLRALKRKERFALDKKRNHDDHFA